VPSGRVTYAIAIQAFSEGLLFPQRSGVMDSISGKEADGVAGPGMVRTTCKIIHCYDIDGDVSRQTVQRVLVVLCFDGGQTLLGGRGEVVGHRMS
jgi:hypothetical protein